MNQFNQYIDSINDPAQMDNIYISSVSFVPTDSEINVLLTQSRSAIKTAERKIVSNVLSKAYKVPQKAALIPESFNPNDTVLNKMAFAGAQKSGQYVELKEGYLYIINDRDIPLEKESNGPNGILVNCQGVYGKNRINLFHKTKKSVVKLLNDYIKARNRNIKAIFKLFVEKMKTYDGDNQDLKNVAKMFEIVLSYLGQYSLSHFGIGVVSFCQTWMRRGDDAEFTLSLGPAQFSVMSPHFQTKFYVTNTSKLEAVVGRPYIDSYIKVMKQFTKNMQANYGTFGAKGGQAFVNLDKLHKKLK